MKKKLDLIFKDEANQEVIESYLYYEKEQVGLGERFINELDQTIHSIKLTPNGFQKFHNETRQVPLNIFPFVVIYRVIENSLIIFSVFKTPQNPKKKLKV